MIRFSIETEIGRPVGEVFAYATDPARLSSWQMNTVSATPEQDGPLKLGSRIREVHRAPGGRELESVVEVDEFEIDRGFGLHVIEGTPIDGRLSFEPSSDGTLMTFECSGRLSGPIRLAEPIMERMLKRQFAANCARLKSVLEGGGPRN